jgi:hypothetical protein
VKYYDETVMGGTREALEAALADWPEVTRTRMFGCPCYKASEHLFAFLVTGGLVLTRLTRPEKDGAIKRFKGVPFRAGPKSVPGWPQLPLDKPAALKRYLPLLRKSYAAACAAD